MYLFETSNSNAVNDQEQNVAGKFGTGTGSGFTGAVCRQGTLCVTNGNIPIEGYESYVDGNSDPILLNNRTFYFNAATNGKDAIGGDTGIYAYNCYHTNEVTDANGNTYRVGGSELGLSLPAGQRGTFTKIKLGETYNFGLDNFSTAPSAGVRTGYATIANGALVYSATAPAAGTGLYFEFSQTRPINGGSFYFGEKYPLTAKLI